MISAVILTKNDEKNIEKCISSVLWCDEVVVIDDYSEDKTIDLIKKFNVKIFQRKVNEDFASQRNFGIEKAIGEWVLFVDADETVSVELQKEIKSKIHDRESNCLGFYLKRCDFFQGRWLKHGETANVKLLRLAKKGRGIWQGSVHEKWLIEGRKSNLTSPLLHYPHKTMSNFLSKINLYSTLRAKELYNLGGKSGFWQIIFYPSIKFLQNYFLRLGFLDGLPGLIMAVMMSFHSFLVRGKLYLLNNNK